MDELYCLQLFNFDVYTGVFWFFLKFICSLNPFILASVFSSFCKRKALADAKLAISNLFSSEVKTLQQNVSCLKLLQNC